MGVHTPLFLSIMDTARGDDTSLYGHTNSLYEFSQSLAASLPMFYSSLLSTSQTPVTSPEDLELSYSVYHHKIGQHYHNAVHGWNLYKELLNMDADIRVKYLGLVYMKDRFALYFECQTHQGFHSK